jgi:hypothetical protein|tara:strand:- start:867 stop:1220 length:354 start_codon:yes stop_codon:yes gene_type:complete
VKLKRRRGSQRQSNVAVMAESTPLEEIETGHNSNQCRCFKMKVLTSHKSEQIDQLLEENLEGESIIFSDKSAGYANISDYVEVHLSEKSDNQTTKSTLRWLHITISNATRILCWYAT